MIKVIAQFHIKNAEVEKALALAKELVLQTKKETGCLNYELFQNAEDTTQLIFIEEWENQAVLQSHFQTPHFTDLVPKLQALTTKDVVITALNRVA
jgi:quinol monooxygenase YgiN